MQLKGLSKPYISDKTIRLNFNQLKCLAFVPSSEVIKCFKLIVSNSAEDFLVILKYFENYYIGKPKRNSNGIRAVPPFPINVWNCYLRVLNDEARTNNSLESWHNVFATDVGDHPTVNKAIEQFRLKQKNTEILYKQLLSGDCYTKRKKSIDKDYMIKEVVLLYGNLNFDKFCERLISNL